MKRQKSTAKPPSFNLDSHQFYLNRELTWLEFNNRVLNEGEDPRIPCSNGYFSWRLSAPTLTNFS